MKRKEAIKQLESKCEVCGSIEALEICAKEPDGKPFYIYDNESSNPDLTKFKLLCRTHGLEFRGDKKRKSKGKTNVKVLRTIMVNLSTWEDLSKVVDLLKEKNMSKSISDTIEQLIKCFLAESSNWLEDHVYDNSEALLEEGGIR